MILGDSLLMMTSLAEKEGLKSKVQMIYMDPPYGVKFGSNWQVSTRKRDVKDGKAEDATREPEVIKAFRDTWQLGIHSYLAYLRERLAVARELISETGSVFVQIGDANMHLVRSLLDEVLGSENFVSQFLYRRGGFQTSEALPNTFDFIRWYAKDRSIAKARQLFIPVSTSEWFGDQGNWVESPIGERKEFPQGDAIPTGWRLHSHRAGYSATGGSRVTSKSGLRGPRFFLRRVGDGLRKRQASDAWLPQTT